FGVVLALPVVRQRLPGNLASGDTTAISERRDKQRVDGGVLHEFIENFVDALVNKRDGADLNPDHLTRLLRGPPVLRATGQRHCRSGLKKVSPVHQVSPYQFSSAGCVNAPFPAESQTANRTHFFPLASNGIWK